MYRTIFGRSLALALTLFLISPSAVAGGGDSVICRNSHISGLEEEYEEAVRVLGSRHILEDTLTSGEKRPAYEVAAGRGL